jgi:hypothetical protein
VIADPANNLGFYHFVYYFLLGFTKERTKEMSPKHCFPIPVNDAFSTLSLLFNA